MTRSPEDARRDVPEDQVAEPATKYGPIELNAEYLERVELVEQLPQNQNGADKSWLRERFRLDEEHFRRVRRIR